MTSPDHAATTELAVQLIDADVHPELRREDELRDYLPEPWRSRPITRLGRPVYRPPNRGRRVDSYPPAGGRPGSDPDLFDRQVLKEARMDFAIHIPIPAGTVPNPDHNAALRTALNDWLAATWLDQYNRHGRYRGSISVPVNHPQAAAREIERWAGHPNFVQVLIPHVGVQLPYGHAFYHPIWETASRHNLPVAIHVTPGGIDPMMTQMGFFTHFLEYHATGYPLITSAQLTSLICSGIFDRLENLKFIFVESGFSWLGPLIWRLDKNWRALKAELPAVRRRPSEYLRDHIRFVSQPIEEPANPRDLLQVFDLLDAEHILMFATDYPHWDYDDPVHAFPRLSPSARQRIFCDNALELFGLPRTRPASSEVQ